MNNLNRKQERVKRKQMPFNSCCRVSQLQPLKTRGVSFCMAFVTPLRNTLELLLKTGKKIWKYIVCRHPLSLLSYLSQLIHVVHSAHNASGRACALVAQQWSICNWDSFMYYFFWVGSCVCFPFWLIVCSVCKEISINVIWHKPNGKKNPMKVMNCDASDNESWPHFMSQSSREVWLSRVQMLFTHTEWGNSQSQKIGCWIFSMKIYQIIRIYTTTPQ